jgi:Protein of unknown function (DUF3352)
MSDHWGTAPQQPEPGPPEILTNQPDALASAPVSYTAPAPTTDLGSSDIIAAGIAPRGGRGKLIAVGAGVLAVAGIGVGAAYAAGALGGGGSQPDKLVPATAVGYVSVDLDPSLGQKVDALRFLRKFPSARASLGSTDDIRKWFFDQATKDDPKLSALTYDHDVKPWIGDRFAVAALPGAAGHSPSALVVLQVTDEGKAKAGLAKLMAEPGDGVCSVSAGYAVCAENQADLMSAKAASARHSLADDPSFKADVASVGKRGIALAWGNLDKVSSLVPAGGSMLGGPFGVAGGIGGLGVGDLGSGGPVGRVVVSLRFDGTSLELTGSTRGATSVVKPGSPGTGVERLPDQTLAAIGGSLDKTAIDQAYARIRSQLGSGGAGSLVDGMDQQLAQLGFRLPRDLDAVLGTKFSVAFGGMGADGMPKVGLTSNAGAVGAGKVLDRLSTQLGRYGAPFELHHAAADHGYAAALNESYARQLAAGGHLGDQKSFRAVVPDAGSAQAVLYVDIAGLVDSGMAGAFGAGGPVDPNVKALGALGLTGTTSGGTSTFRMTLTTR